ncbi:WAT1-related protein At3g28050 [Linum perenne]
MTRLNFYRDVLPFAAMVSLQIINVGINTLFKAATMEGMNYHVFIVYDYAIAAFSLLPAPFISKRSRVLPPLSSPIMCKIGLLGIIGSSSQIMAYTGINYSSPTLASAISNLTPAFTFLFAIIFSSTTQHWVLGGICLTVKYILDPLWYIVLTHIMKEYPAEVTVIFFYNLFVCIITAVFALITEGTLSSAWMLSTKTAIASVFCSGLLGSSMSNGVDAWVLRVKGPVFLSMFKPFSMIIAVTMGVIFLGDILRLGSLIGATTIAIGFYMLMWGKAKEEGEGPSEQRNHASNSSLLPQSMEKVPLLQSCKDEGMVDH